MTIYVGIDNGLSGAIVAINSNQNVIEKWIMPVTKGKGGTQYNLNGIIDIMLQLKSHKGNIFVMLEKAHVRPVSGKRASFMTGYGYGVMQALLTSLKLPYEIINPSVWQKEILIGLNRDDKKQASIMFCQQKFPDVDLTPTERSKKPSDGLSDALCMAVYCYRKNR